jgi:16S rRNA (cytosine1402-N4)-methyltransferase
VKEAFRRKLREGVYEAISPDPIGADEAEQRANPRSRSAKLRWARRARDDV